VILKSLSKRGQDLPPLPPHQLSTHVSMYPSNPPRYLNNNR